MRKACNCMVGGIWVPSRASTRRRRAGGLLGLISCRYMAVAMRHAAATCGKSSTSQLREVIV